MSLTRSVWVIESFRPGMRIIDSTRNKYVRELLEAYENDTIDDHPKAKKMGKKHVAALSLDHNDKEKAEMVVATADDQGKFVTDDPVVAYNVHKLLMSSFEINHPLSRKAVKCEVDRLSPPIPTEAEVAKILKDREIKK